MEQDANRQVVIAGWRGATYRNNAPDASDKVFLNGTDGMGTYSLARQKVWGRVINTEPKNVNSCFTWDGATVWVFGYKTESNSTSHAIKSGGKLEILGGITNQTAFAHFPTTGVAILSVQDSQASASLHTDGFNQNIGYDFAVIDSKSSTVRQLPFDDLVPRPTRTHQTFMPLYVDAAP